MTRTRLLEKASEIARPVALILLVLAFFAFVVWGIRETFFVPTIRVQGETDGLQASNSERVPVAEVVGLPVEEACRKLAESRTHGGRVVEVRRAEGARPGRVVAQEPEGGTIPDRVTVVALTVAGPFSEEELPPDTACEDAGEK